MDKIAKFLKKLKKKDLEALLFVMQAIKLNEINVPGVRKIVGKENHYRARVGKYRIVFHVGKNGPEILRLSKRNEKTYKDL